MLHVSLNQHEDVDTSIYEVLRPRRSAGVNSLSMQLVLESSLVLIASGTCVVMAFLQVHNFEGFIPLQAWEELMQDATAKAAPESSGDGSKEQKDAAEASNADESKSADAQDEGGEVAADAEQGSVPEDFSALISSEVKDLKDKKKQPFVGHDTGIKTCLFVHMPLVSKDTPGPNEV